ncbi:peptidylprolyl isomerase [Pontibaca methylaminivorans]|uniref:Parvulin-like PPIase n=1 Tax=Pontibaca methylaminivorans TaxID=515897 RepID=A0A1R3WYU9_9RHOB|nr:peptidylprolyl isomerase [Pontibaca methylaminivorans]SIT83693.1 periplasmic chaperone for outer membrane proteins SurA [Pontibaca methylaminivorans]
MQLRISLPIPSLPRFRRGLRPFACGLALAIGTALMPLPGLAQNLFAPVITVNDAAITGFEIEQRARFLHLLRAPGDPMQMAREALIEDRLKQQAIRDAEIEISEEDIRAGIAEFSQRTDLSPEEFVEALQQGGVSYESLRDFVSVNVGWREYVRTTFMPRAAPSKAEIDQARAAGNSGSSVSVLLNEIIVPVTPENMDQVEGLAEELSKIRGFDAFGEAARRYSASESRQAGGQIPWMAVNDLPAGLRPLIMELKPGEVTPPIPLSNAVALFQMREMRETGRDRDAYSKVSYAKYYIPGGHSPEGLKQAAEVAARVDRCDDLFGIAAGQPPEVLEKVEQAPGEIPQDIAIELAKLDRGEISTTLTRNSGQTLLFLMLCNRTAESAAEASDDDIGNMLAQQRLEAFSENQLAKLRGNAVITER